LAGRTTEQAAERAHSEHAQGEEEPPMIEPTHLTVQEAAQLLRLSRLTLYQPEWKLRLRMVKIGGRLLVPAEQVQRLLKGHDGPATGT
jgi:excisionase family DNA binding protein